jgi:hypothetical protein
VDPGDTMTVDSLKQPNFGPGFGVQIAALEANLIAGNVRRDPFGWIEFHALDPVLANGHHISGLLSQFEHRGPLPNTAKPAERMKIIDGDGILWRRRRSPRRGCVSGSVVLCRGKSPATRYNPI